MSNITKISENKPLLSVIIPVYNVEDYLRQALDSVRNQSYKNVEFIVINDGSTDSSGRILQEYQLRDNRFRVFGQKNSGPSAARNRGLREARGDIIYFFDSDDVLAEGAFEKLVQQLQETNSQAVLFSCIFIDENGDPYDGTPRNEFEQKQPISGSACIQKLMKSGRYGCSVPRFFFRKTFLLENNLRFDDGYLQEDESFTLEVYCLADRISALGNPFLKRRFRPNSITTSKKSEINIKGWAKAIERVLNFLNQKNIDSKTREAVLIRLRSIAHTAIRTLDNLDNPKNPIEHYLPGDLQDELGLLVKVHARSTFLYRVLRFLNRKIG